MAANPECVGRYSFTDFIASAVCYDNPLRTGRYVGIMTTKKQFLQLCEVEIYSRGNLPSLSRQRYVKLVFNSVAGTTVSQVVL